MKMETKTMETIKTKIEKEDIENYTGKKGLYKIPRYQENHILRRLIYFQAKSNISKFAKDLGVTRQELWGIISGRSKPSPQLAKRISEKLGLDSRIIFPDGSINYPDFKYEDEYFKSKKSQMKNETKIENINL